jgi:N6-adenosine-specific RNA methylase IME4
MIGETRCRCLVADPAWSFHDRLPGPSRGAASNYRVMTLPEICAFSLPPFEPNAWLFLWRVSSQVEAAYSVVRAWGFKPKSEIVWEKLTVNGKPHFGMGRYVRASHETCIVAVRGRVTPLDRSVRSRFAAPVGLHSAKPEAFYSLVERLTDGPFVELFARRRRPGWFSFGDELGVEVPYGESGCIAAPVSPPGRSAVGGIVSCPQSDLGGDVPPDLVVAGVAADGVASPR